MALGGTDPDRLTPRATQGTPATFTPPGQQRGLLPVPSPQPAVLPGPTPGRAPGRSGRRTELLAPGSAVMGTAEHGRAPYTPRVRGTRTHTRARARLPDAAAAARNG